MDRRIGHECVARALTRGLLQPLDRGPEITLLGIERSDILLSERIARLGGDLLVDECLARVALHHAVLTIVEAAQLISAEWVTGSSGTPKIIGRSSLVLVGAGPRPIRHAQVIERFAIAACRDLLELGYQPV